MVRDCKKGNTKSVYYHHTDHLGTTVCITDSTGKVVWECEHEAFGKVISKKDNTFTPNFTGKFLDKNTGLYYFNARWYDAETGKFITEDPVRNGRNWYVYCENNPLKYVDPHGLSTTLDDFAYQQRTENSPYKTNGTPNQEIYNKSFVMEKEYASRNQGLSEYGRIVENFHDFSEKRFTEENPLNQEELDKILGYKRKIGKTTSCMIAAMINAYASLFKSGITGLQILNALFDGNGNITDCIGQDINNIGEYSFYCRNLWKLSYLLGNSMDARAKDFANSSDSEDITKVFLQPSEKIFDLYLGNFSPNEFQKMISMSLGMTNNKSKYTISGLVDRRNIFDIKTYQSKHYVFSMVNQIIDSLDPNRKQAAFYITNSYYNLQLTQRY